MNYSQIVTEEGKTRDATSLNWPETYAKVQEIIQHGGRCQNKIWEFCIGSIVTVQMLYLSLVFVTKPATQSFLEDRSEKCVPRVRFITTAEINICIKYKLWNSHRSILDLWSTPTPHWSPRTHLRGLAAWRHVVRPKKIRWVGFSGFRAFMRLLQLCCDSECEDWVPTWSWTTAGQCLNLYTNNIHPKLKKQTNTFFQNNFHSGDLKQIFL